MTKELNFFLKRLFCTLALLIPMVLFQNCGKLESSNLDLASLEDIGVARGQSLYSQNCASCHGSISGSSVLNRSLGQILVAISNQPQMSHLSFLDSSELQAIANAISFESGGDGIIVPPNGQGLVFACDSNVRPNNDLLKLTNREFRNSLNSLLDSFSLAFKNDNQLNSLYSLISSDVAVENRDTFKEQAKLVTRGGVISKFNVVLRAAELVVSDNNALSSYPNTGSCLASSDISRGCFDSFITEFATRAYRRPLSNSEEADLRSVLWSSSMSKEELLQSAFIFVAHSPDFQYKAFNRGTPVSGESNILSLTNYELASKISFLITGFPPDDELRSLADSGQLSNETILNQQLDRLLNTNNAKDMMSRLFRESYGYDYFNDFNYSNNFRGPISLNGLQNAMVSELDDYFSSLVIDQDANFETLLTSRYSSINNSSLAQIYGVSSGSNLNLPASRAGFLNRGAMLTKRSGSRASPIKRGLSVLEHVLCTDVGEPPPSAPTSLPDLGNQPRTTREITELTSEVPGSSCVTCHSRINPLGYAFENFDSLGRERSQEALYDSNDIVQNYLNVNTSATTLEIGSESHSFTGSDQLVSDIGRSDRAKLCFVKHLKKFESRSVASAGDYCQMNEMLDVVYGKSGGTDSIKEIIKSLVNSSNFKKWSY